MFRDRKKNMYVKIGTRSWEISREIIRNAGRRMTRTQLAIVVM